MGRGAGRGFGLAFAIDRHVSGWLGWAWIST